MEGLDAGADDYLVKPFAGRELTARVAAHVTLARVRERARIQLAAVGARLSNIFAQAPVAIAVLRGSEHVYELANEPYRRLVGNRELIGHSIRDAFPEFAGQAIYEILDGVFTTRVPFVGTELRVLMDQHGLGVPEEIFFNFVYQPLIDADGAVEGIAVVVSDVTDLVRSRRTAESAQRDAEKANRAKSEFLAAMSHELRTPLNAIAGYVQLLEMGVHGPITDEQREALGRVQQSEQHLLALITDVLNFAKLEAGRVEYRVREVSLARVVASAAPIIEPQLVAKGISFEVHIPPELTVTVDEDKLRQILLNLLSNAGKFTEAGGRVTVDATLGGGVAAPRGSVVFLRVSDTGVGIAREKLDSIFDPFVQVHRHLTRSTEGTGLGLAISRDLARAMKGDLRARSVEGGGSTFTVTLPVGVGSPMTVASPDGEADSA